MTITGRKCCGSSDRHDRDMLYGPTNEEQVTDIFRQHMSAATRRCR